LFDVSFNLAPGIVQTCIKQFGWANVAGPARAISVGPSMIGDASKASALGPRARGLARKYVKGPNQNVNRRPTCISSGACRIFYV